MLANPLLSICIPTYKSRQTIYKLMNSIIEQEGIVDKTEFEIIVSDNCSNDGTLEYLHEIEKLVPIKVSTNTSNIGMIPNWEKVISLANGKFVWLLGSDDFIVQGGVKIVLDGIKKQKVDLFICNNIYWTSQSNDNNLSNSFVRSTYTEDFGVEYAKELIKTRSDAFTPIYCTIMLKEYWSDVFLLYNKEFPFFSSVANSVPQALYVANNLMNKPAFYFGKPLVVSSLNISWQEYFPLYMCKILPDLYDVFLENGADRKVIQSHKKELIQAGHFSFVPRLTNQEIKHSIYFSFLVYCMQFYQTKGFTTVLKKVIYLKLKKIFYFLSPLKKIFSFN